MVATPSVAALLVGSLISGAAAAPALGSRQDAPDCSPRSSTGLKPECWDALDVPTFLRDWLETEGAAAGCDSVGFAQCFLQANGFGGLTCDLITSNTCPPFDTTQTYESDQHFYALWNIYAIHQFFSQYSAALTAGQSLASGSVAKIVQTVNPPTASTLAPNILGQVLGSTLSVAGLASGFVPGGGVLLTGINTALGIPALKSLLFPDSGAGVVDNRFINFADIDSQISTLVSDYQFNLLNMVQAAEGNLDNFLAMTTGGAFSQRVTTSLTVQANTLYRNLQTYVLSEALTAAGFVIAKSPDTDPVQVATEVSSQINCPGIGPDGNCFQYFVDSGNTYVLHKASDYGNAFVDLLDTIKEEKWVPDLKTLFAVEGCQDKDSAFDDATLSLSCPVTVKICEYDYTEGAGVTDRPRQFLNCDSDERFWPAQTPGIVTEDCVAASYLGPRLRRHVQFGPTR